MKQKSKPKRVDDADFFSILLLLSCAALLIAFVLFDGQRPEEIKPEFIFKQNHFSKCIFYSYSYISFPNKLGELKLEERHSKCDEEKGIYFVYDREAQLYNREIDKRLHRAEEMCEEIGFVLSKGYCVGVDENFLIKKPIGVHDGNVYFIKEG